MLLISPSAICCWKIHTEGERKGEGMCFRLQSLMFNAPIWDRLAASGFYFHLMADDVFGAYSPSPFFFSFHSFRGYSLETSRRFFSPLL